MEMKNFCKRKKKTQHWPKLHMNIIQSMKGICPLTGAKQGAAKKTSKIWISLPRESLSGCWSFTKQLLYR